MDTLANLARFFNGFKKETSNLNSFQSLVEMSLNLKSLNFNLDNFDLNLSREFNKENQKQQLNSSSNIATIDIHKIPNRTKSKQKRIDL